MRSLIAKPVTESIEIDVQNGAALFEKKFHRKPKLSVIIVGSDPASQIYVKKKKEKALALGMLGETYDLPASTSPNQVRALVDRLNQDPEVDGILIQRPLPKSFVEEEVMYWVDPAKDVDAFHPDNVGRLLLGAPRFSPCTPAGVMELLAHYQVSVAGKVACVIGRSSIVGKPMAALLINASATVLHCHSQTPDLASFTRQADIVVVAVGKAGFLTGDQIKPGAVIIDVGINRRSDGKVVGDVDFDSVSKTAAALSPVPGGVGPMTIAMLMRATLKSAQNRV